MAYHRKGTKDCKEARVPICAIEELIQKKQADYLMKTGSHLSVPRAIIKLVLGE
jgi:hypothetical protein